MTTSPERMSSAVLSGLLPLRKKEVLELRQRLREGMVLVPESDRKQTLDIKYAAQGEISEYFCEEIPKIWQPPKLDCEPSDFYKVFAEIYTIRIEETEKLLWDALVKTIHGETAAHETMQSLSPLQAAVLTIEIFPGSQKEPTPLSTHELFIELAKHANVYEQLLRKKYGAHFNNELFYECTKKYLNALITRLISADSLILHLYRMTVQMGAHEEYIDDDLNPDCFLLNEHDALIIKQEFIQVLKEYATEQGYKSDNRGRTENRGCPFLLAGNFKKYIDFSISELTRQHRLIHQS
jgi:hypothetical protein